MILNHSFRHKIPGISNDILAFLFLNMTPVQSAWKNLSMDLYWRRTTPVQSTRKELEARRETGNKNIEIRSRAGFVHLKRAFMKEYPTFPRALKVFSEYITRIFSLFFINDTP